MTDGPEPYPDSPVARVEIEHANGTVKRLSGDAATSWTRSVDAAVGEAAIRGRDMPTDIGWETWKLNREGEMAGDQDLSRTLQWVVLVESPLVGLTGLVMFYDGLDHLMANGFTILWLIATLVGLVMMFVGLFGLRYLKNAGGKGNDG